MRKLMVLAALLAAMAGTAGAEGSARLRSRVSLSPGIIGAYKDASNYIGGLGARATAEFAVSKAMSVSVMAGAADHLVDGSFAGGGADLKLKLVEDEGFLLSADGFGSFWYMFGLSGVYSAGGGAALLATLPLGKLDLNAGVGASYDVFWGTLDDGVGSIGLYATAGAGYALSKAAALGLSCEYGSDRFFLGASLDFTLPSKQPAKAPAKAPSKPAPAKPTTKKK